MAQQQYIYKVSPEEFIIKETYSSAKEHLIGTIIGILIFAIIGNEMRNNILIVIMIFFFLLVVLFQILIPMLNPSSILLNKTTKNIVKNGKIIRSIEDIISINVLYSLISDTEGYHFRIIKLTFRNNNDLEILEESNGQVEMLYLDLLVDKLGAFLNVPVIKVGQ